MTRCTSQTGGYSATQCESLKEVAEPGGLARRKNQKGIFYVFTVNTSSNERLGTCFTAHSGSHVPAGIVMNACPFCLGPLRDYSEET